jgi:hypothetical protein
MAIAPTYSFQQLTMIKILLQFPEITLLVGKIF